MIPLRTPSSALLHRCRFVRGLNLPLGLLCRSEALRHDSSVYHGGTMQQPVHAPYKLSAASAPRPLYPSILEARTPLFTPSFALRSLLLGLALGQPGEP